MSLRSTNFRGGRRLASRVIIAFGVLCGLLVTGAASAGEPHYLRIAGSAFHPTDSSVTYLYGNTSCISGTSNSPYAVTHKVMLPGGVRVKRLRLYFYDNAPSGHIQGIFTWYHQRASQGTVAHNLVTVNSVDSGGYDSVLSSELYYDTAAPGASVEAMNVMVWLDTINSYDLRFCGARIKYYVADDVIFADGLD